MSDRGFRIGVGVALIGVLLILLGYSVAGLVLLAIGALLAIFS